MISASLAAFINAQSELASEVAGIGLSVKAFAKTEDTILSQLKAPFALVAGLPDGPQDLWSIGNKKRMEDMS